MAIDKKLILNILYNQVYHADKFSLNELYHSSEEGIIIYEFGDLQLTYFVHKAGGYNTLVNHNDENDLQVDDRVILNANIAFLKGSIDIAPEILGN